MMHNRSAFGFPVTESATPNRLATTGAERRPDSLLTQFTHFHGLCSKCKVLKLNCNKAL